MWLLKGLLRKARGWSFYSRTVPTAFPEASVLIWKGCEKSGRARTGAELRLESSKSQLMYRCPNKEGMLLEQFSQRLCNEAMTNELTVIAR